MSRPDPERRYSGTLDQRRALKEAIRTARNVSGLSDERLANLIMAEKEAGRIPGYAVDAHVQVSRATINRYRSDDDPHLEKAQPAIVGLIYSFLVHSSDIVTPLSASAAMQSHHPLSPLLQELMTQFGAKRVQIDLDALGSLEGTFYLYRKAWTSQDAPTFIRSILTFERHGDILTYREMQRYRDSVSQLDVDQTETGIVMPFGSNIVMLGRADRTDGIKFFSIHAFYNAPDGQVRTGSFSGNLIAVFGKGPHPGFSFEAVRVRENEKPQCAFYIGDDLEQNLRRKLEPRT